jgi:ubiquinone biosynthesis protein UbiJ
MELAQEVSFLAKNLTWDAEEDLSKLVGDIAAHRIVSTARAFIGWSADSGVRIAQGAAEYWTEEAPLVATRVKVDTFVDGVAELRDAVERLEKRISKLG